MIDKLKNLHDDLHRELSTLAFALARVEKLFRQRKDFFKLVETETQKAMLAEQNSKGIIESIKKELDNVGQEGGKVI